MLTHLEIRNFTIAEHLHIELASGMTVLTGETGAGKSILVDALGLLLGERAGPGLVRNGAERAELSAVFSVAGMPEVGTWLEEQALDQGDAECVLRRTLTADGPARAFINGRPVPLQSLRDLGDKLVDIHGQHAHQSLLRRDVQRLLLDGFAHTEGLLARARELERRWHVLQRQLEAGGGDPQAGERERDLLRFQRQELQALELGPGDVQALDEEYGRLANAGRLLEVSARTLHDLEDDESGAALTRIEAAKRGLEALLAIDPRLRPMSDLLQTASVHLQEAISGLRHYAAGVELDPQRLRWVEERIATLHDLARKHRVAPEGLVLRLQEIEARLVELEGGAERRRQLEAEQAALLSEYADLAAALHQARSQAAAGLSKAVEANMHGLGMPVGRFEVRVQRMGGAAPCASGDDSVEFLVSANPGQPLQPLTRVASGGELSRISLAIQVIGSARSGVPTLVFDEVDVGVGGGVAEMVGRQLRRLSLTRQVLCVTHLPQVAALGVAHMKVHKFAEDGATFARVEPLQGEQRVRELARMLGGIEITAQTLAHAREMLERAEFSADADSSPARSRRAESRSGHEC